MYPFRHKFFSSNKKNKANKLKGSIDLTTLGLHFKGEGLSGTPTSSTWNQFAKKVRILVPFIWPRKSMQLQLRVIFCLALLVAGRFINVYVPIYSKLIGKLNF